MTSARLSDKEAVAKVEEAIRKFGGYAPTLEAAIGTFWFGRSMGWEVVYLMHSYSTIRKYEKLLALNFKAQMEPSTELSRKNYSWAWAKKFNRFWRAVRGQEAELDRTRIDVKPVNVAKLTEHRDM